MEGKKTFILGNMLIYNYYVIYIGGSFLCGLHKELNFLRKKQTIVLLENYFCFLNKVGHVTYNIIMEISIYRSVDPTPGC